ATKDGVTSAPATINVTTTLVSITISPDNIYLSGGDTEQLIALASYSDGTKIDVTDSVLWDVDDSSVIGINSVGVIGPGSIPYGTTKVTASQDSVVSNESFITACNDLSGPCVDKFDVGSGKLFTSGASIAFTDAIGVPYQTASGDFARYEFSQATVLCDNYKAIALFERTNWRIPTTSELQNELVATNNNLSGDRGWDWSLRTWSGTLDVPESVNLSTGIAYSASPLSSYFTTCVSEP
ncbi:TPA: hypothetical protein ACN33Q_004549, partial [Vibrio parahaemolyticus]